MELSKAPPPDRSLRTLKLLKGDALFTAFTPRGCEVVMRDLGTGFLLVWRDELGDMRAAVLTDGLEATRQALFIAQHGERPETARVAEERRPS